MRSEDKEVLTKVCYDVFEHLAFMFCEEFDGGELRSDSDSFIKASMSFKGDRSGTIEIIVPSGLARSLVFNILGIEQSDNIEPGSAEDAIKELLNTICGSMLTSLFGDKVVFNLSVPEASEINSEEWESLVENKDYIAIDVEENPVLINASL